MIGAQGVWLGTARVRLLTAAALFTAGLPPVLDRDLSWLGSWKKALDQGTFSITTLGPVAAGIACVVYVRLRRSGVPDLLSQARRPWLGWLAPALGVWALASAAVLLICALTTTAAWAAGAHTYPELFWVVPPALAVLGAEVSIGAMMGSRIGHYWAAPWAAVSVFTLFILSSVGVVPGVFRTGGTSGSLSAETFAIHPIAAQAVAALGLGVAVMALSHWDLFRTSSTVHRGMCAVLVAAAIPALFRLHSDSDERYVSSSVEYECRDGQPTVCMLEETTRPLDDLAARMQRLAGPLVAAGVALPARFVQKLPGDSNLDEGSVRLFADEELGATVTDETAARSLAQPADCPAYSSDSPEDLPEVVFTIDRVLTHWILVQDGQASAPTEGGLADWWALPAEDQHPWVRTTYDALSDCRLNALRLPQ
ncbi:hypothetical protein D0Z08_17370 [Nocardioides immobilis]|uniref:DUF7224 domain-containing protein n=1 Tax=Nocardioides immobilis TaxID=2049295 RepID=A0A417XZJ9_9ACTN|nr:hypothetical protein [Nocardioides immobilis]RHW25812.1 hypothetical protein D0Z08_17370 [Nocardioides immobilis]